MKRKLILTLAIGLLSHLGFAQDFDRTKLDNFFNALETNNRFMGSVAISKEGEIIYTKTIGFSDIENNIKANENSKYRIAALDGFVSMFRNFSDEDVSLAIILNGINFTVYDVSIAVLSAVFHKPYDVPVFKTYELKSEDLDKYLGVYSSPDYPLKITITKDNHTLIAQATGQSAYPLEATGKDKFNVFKTIGQRIYSEERIKTAANKECIQLWINLLGKRAGTQETS